MESVETFTCALYSSSDAFPHAIGMSSALICDEVKDRLTGDNDDSELTTFLFTLSKVPKINPTIVF